MKRQLFLSWTLLLLAYGVWCQNPCESLEKRVFSCFGEVKTGLFQPFTRTDESYRLACSTRTPEFFRDCFKRLPTFAQESCSKKHPNLMENLKISQNLIEEAINFVCRDDAKYLLEYQRDGLCFLDSNGRVEKCQKDHPFITILGSYSESFCSSVDEGLNCINETIKVPQCMEDQQKFLNEFYQTLKFNTPCKKEN